MPVIDGDGQRWRDWEVKGNAQRGHGGQDGNMASYIKVKEINKSRIPISERRFDDEFLRPSVMQFSM